MTDTEWQAMPVRARDAFLAEHVEGWHWINLRDDPNCPIDYRSSDAKRLFPQHVNSWFTEFKEHGKYHTDPAAALRLLEKMWERCYWKADNKFGVTNVELYLRKGRTRVGMGRSEGTSMGDFCAAACSAVRQAVEGK